MYVTETMTVYNQWWKYIYLSTGLDISLIIYIFWYIVFLLQFSIVTSYFTYKIDTQN